MNRRPEFVSLVIHHPSRRLECLFDCLASLRTATAAPHHITLYMQGTRDDVTIEELRDFVSPADLSITVFGEHMGPVVPRILSLDSVRDINPKWWAKLDDDAAVPPGAWDLLAEALEHAGEDAFCAMASPNGTLLPRRFVTQGAALVLEQDPRDTPVQVRPELAYTVCDFVGDGATVFRASPFLDDGLCFDVAFERGADLDLLFAAHAFGFHALLCSPPDSKHDHASCANPEYDAVRYDAQAVWRAAVAFRQKWKLDCPHLSQFGVRIPGGSR